MISYWNPKRRENILVAAMFAVAENWFGDWFWSPLRSKEEIRKERVFLKSCPSNYFVRRFEIISFTSHDFFHHYVFESCWSHCNSCDLRNTQGYPLIFIAVDLLNICGFSTSPNLEPAKLPVRKSVGWSLTSKAEKIIGCDLFRTPCTTACGEVISLVFQPCPCASNKIREIIAFERNGPPPRATSLTLKEANTDYFTPWLQHPLCIYLLCAMPFPHRIEKQYRSAKLGSRRAQGRGRPSDWSSAWQKKLIVLRLCGLQLKVILQLFNVLGDGIFKAKWVCWSAVKTSSDEQ